MPPVLTTIRWRDIPAQVVAKDGRRTAKQVLHRRFQVAIDRAAMQAGKRDYAEYIGEWVSDREPCGEDLEAIVAARAAELEAAHPREVLATLVENGGWRDPSAHETHEPAAGARVPGHDPGAPEVTE